MLFVDGRRYGTADDIAATLGADVTPHMIRNWARRDGLRGVRVGRSVCYPLLDAAIIEAHKRSSTRGRKRRVDDQPQHVA